MERGSLSRGGEVSLGRSKSLMAILKEQNHSCRWLRSLYLGAENEGNGTSEPQGGLSIVFGVRRKTWRKQEGSKSECRESKSKVKNMCGYT